MRRALLVLVAALLLAPGCLSDDDAADGGPTPSTTAPPTGTTPGTAPTPAATPTPTNPAGGGSGATTLLASHERFAIDLLRILNDETPGENLVVSPYSIATALQMMVGGADGSTRPAMRDALRLGSVDATMDEEARDLLTQLTTSVPNVTLRIGNSLWIDQAFAPNVNDSFSKRIGSFYEGESRVEDFRDPATVDAVNEWASEATDGAIPKVLDELAEDEVMILLNAVLFEGAWTQRFSPECTYDGEFHKEDGTTETVDMMCLPASGSMVGRREMAEDERGITIRLPYGERFGPFAMYVMLPTNGTDLDAFTASWNGSVPASERMRPDAELHMPRVAIRTSSLDLEPALTGMGMGVAFTDQANFDRIARNLYISRVIHDALLEVDENGTRAAAVTTVVSGVTSMPPPPTVVVLDRPFLVAIRDDDTGALLFVAKVHEPGGA